MEKSFLHTWTVLPAGEKGKLRGVFRSVDNILFGPEEKPCEDPAWPEGVMC